MLEQSINCNIALTEFLKGVCDGISEEPGKIIEGETLEMRYKNHKIEKRKDGRWQARFRIEGKQVTVYGATQQQCLDKLKKTMNEKRLNPVPQKRLKFFEAWEFWIERYKKPFVSERVLKNIESVFKNQIKKNFKNEDLGNLKSVDLNLSIKNIDQERMKEFTCQYLKCFLTDMFEEKLIKRDFSKEIISFHATRKEGVSLTEAQRKTLIEKSYQIKDGELFRFYLFTGCRPAEVFLIRGKDIEENFIHIPGTKTIKSNRFIPRFKQVDEILSKMNLKNEDDFIFKITEITRKRRLTEMRKLCGFNFTYKDLRTTFATMCAEAGVKQNVIAKWLGHTNVSTTNKYYIKVLSDYEKEQISGLENKLDSTFDTHFDT